MMTTATATRAAPATASELLIDVHRDGHPAATLDESEALDGADILPGFSCAVREVFGG